MYNVNTRGVQAPNVVVGMAIFSGGLLQFMAGMWEFPRGNTFGATGNALHSLFDTCIYHGSLFFRSSLLVWGLLDVLRHHPHPKLRNHSCVC